MPHVIGRFGRDTVRDVAIDEWMAASPIYTKRMQRLLDFEGDTVETIFKGMQLDVGAPPEFMDFRYVVHDDSHGEFRLDRRAFLLHVAERSTVADALEIGAKQLCGIAGLTTQAPGPAARGRPRPRRPRRRARRASHVAAPVLHRRARGADRPR